MQWLFVDYQFYSTDLMPVPDNLDYWSYMTSVCTALFKFSDSLLIFSHSSIYYWKGSTKVPKLHYYFYCHDLLLIVCVCYYHFSLKFCQFLLPVFWSSVKCINVWLSTYIDWLKKYRLSSIKYPSLSLRTILF